MSEAIENIPERLEDVANAIELVDIPESLKSEPEGPQNGPEVTASSFELIENVTEESASVSEDTADWSGAFTFSGWWNFFTGTVPQVTDDVCEATANEPRNTTNEADGSENVAMATDNEAEVTENVPGYSNNLPELDAPKIIMKKSSNDSVRDVILRHLNARNAIRYYELTYRKNDKYLNMTTFDQEIILSRCEKIFTHNIEFLMKSKEFMECNYNTLQTMLRVTKQNCSEEFVFDQCIEWAKHWCREHKIKESLSNLRAVLGEGFDHIRFHEMECKQFAKRYKLYHAMFTETDKATLVANLRAHNFCFSTSLVEYDLSPESTVAQLTDILNLTKCDNAKHSRAIHANVEDGINFQLPYSVGDIEVGFLAKFEHNFKVSKPVVLRGLSFSRPLINPFDEKQSIYLDGSIVVQRSEIHKTSTIWEYVKSNDFHRIMFDEPLLIEPGYTYSIVIKIDVDYNNKIVEIPAHTFEKVTQDSIDLIPICKDSGQEQSSPTIISAFHFSPSVVKETSQPERTTFSSFFEFPILS